MADSDQEDHSEDRVTVWMSSDLVDDVDDHVDWRYGSRSQWVREAAKTRIALEDALATQGVDLPDEETARDELIETIVRNGVLAAGDELEDVLADAEEETNADASE